MSKAMHITGRETKAQLAAKLETNRRVRAAEEALKTDMHDLTTQDEIAHHLESLPRDTTISLTAGIWYVRAPSWTHIEQTNVFPDRDLLSALQAAERTMRQEMQTKPEPFHG